VRGVKFVFADCLLLVFCVSRAVCFPALAGLSESRVHAIAVCSSTQRVAAAAAAKTTGAQRTRGHSSACSVAAVLILARFARAGTRTMEVAAAPRRRRKLRLPAAGQLPTRRLAAAAAAGVVVVAAVVIGRLTRSQSLVLAVAQQPPGMRTTPTSPRFWRVRPPPALLLRDSSPQRSSACAQAALSLGHRARHQPRPYS
jgi:hypothetical protein